MTSLRQRMLEDMQLRGLGEKTQEAYLRAVRQLAVYHGKAPDQIDEEELRQYFLYLKNEKKHRAAPVPSPFVALSSSSKKHCNESG